MAIPMENYIPGLLENGFVTDLDVTFNGNLTVVGTTTIAGISLTDLTVTGNTTIGNAATDTLVVTGVSTFTAGATTDAVNITGTSITTGKAIDIIDLAALTSGIGINVTSAATAITGAGRLIYSSHSGVSTTSGILNEFASAAADETVIHKVTASAALTGVASQVSALATVTGVIVEARATAATLTTGRYYSAHDAAGEVFGVGTNGHIISTVSASAPTIAVTQQNGITAAAITAGGSDTCGTITTTGTNNNGGTSILQVTFGKTYTTAPKAVLLFPANASGALTVNANGAAPYVSAVTATTFDITIPADAAAGATPSWRYLVIA